MKGANYTPYSTSIACCQAVHQKTPDAQRSAAVLFLRHAARRRQRGLAAQVHIRLTTNKNLWRRTQQMAWNPVSSAFSRWCSHVRFVCFRCVSLWMRRGCWGVWRERGRTGIESIGRRTRENSITTILCTLKRNCLSMEITEWDCVTGMECLYY